MFRESQVGSCSWRWSNLIVGVLAAFPRAPACCTTRFERWFNCSESFRVVHKMLYRPRVQIQRSASLVNHVLARELKYWILFKCNRSRSCDLSWRVDMVLMACSTCSQEYLQQQSAEHGRYPLNTEPGFPPSSNRRCHLDYSKLMMKIGQSYRIPSENREILSQNQPRGSWNLA